jgi:hypothetical protein
VDDETVFRIRGVEEPTLADVEVGDVVAGVVVKQDDDTLLAKVVAVLPPQNERLRGLGKVTAVGDDALTVEGRGGETRTIAVDDETVFRIRGVEEPTLADLEIGDVVAGVVIKQDDDTLLAKVVAVVPPRPRQ